MYIVIFFFGIIIQLIIITFLALVIAVPLCAIICSAIFHTGCGMDGYYKAALPNGYCITSIDDEFGEVFLTGSIIKHDAHIISNVAEIKVTGDSIYGKQYSLNQSPKNGHYFLLDSKNDNLICFHHMMKR